MLNTKLIHGGRTNTSGLCPSCGGQVPRTHVWSSAKAGDKYACTACGTFEYSTEGVHMPLVATASPPTIGQLVDVVH